MNRGRKIIDNASHICFTEKFVSSRKKNCTLKSKFSNAGVGILKIYQNEVPITTKNCQISSNLCMFETTTEPGC